MNRRRTFREWCSDALDTCIVGAGRLVEAILDALPWW